MGPVIDVGADRGKLLALTLAIDCAVEKETIVVFISGMTDKTNWGNEPLASFPPKHYCGIYSILLNLAKYPDARSIRRRENRALGSACRQLDRAIGPFSQRRAFNSPDPSGCFLSGGLLV
jgi:hypothetical protein